MQTHKFLTLVLFCGTVFAVHAADVPENVKERNQFREFQLGQGMIYEVYVKSGDGGISLFRGGGIGNALAMTLNTASNVMAITKAGQSTEKGLSKDVSEMLKRGSGGGSSGGGNSGRGTQ